MSAPFVTWLNCFRNNDPRLKDFAVRLHLAKGFVVVLLLSTLVPALGRRDVVKQGEWVVSNYARCVEHGGRRAENELRDYISNATYYERLGIAYKLIDIMAEPRRKYEPAVWGNAIAPSIYESAFCGILRITGQDISRYTKEGVVELPSDVKELGLAYVAAYRRGIVDATEPIRRSADIPRLRDSLGPTVRRGLNTDSIEERQAALSALRRIFDAWPPIGGDMRTLCVIIGVEAPPEGKPLHMAFLVRGSGLFVSLEPDGQEIRNVRIQLPD